MKGPTSAFSREMYEMKYLNPGEDFEAGMKRIAKALKDDEQHYKAFNDILMNMRFLPGGRVQAAMGSPREVTAFNCYYSGDIADTFVDGSDSIMARATEAAQTMRLGGGIGYSFSNLRPRGDLIKTLNSQSSGAVSFMQIFNSVCACVSSAGHRRGAQMGVLRVDHPDIVEFVNAKTIPGNLTNFNVSVAITHKFMECLDNGKPFPLQFGGKIYREIDAAELWELIMRNTWDWAEPGVLFIDTINDYNNLHYTEEISGTNPCVSGDTPILTRSGYVSIEECVDKETDVWNGKEFSTTIPRITGYNQQMLTVTLSDGATVTCTPAHKFILHTGERVEARLLALGDKLSTCDIWPTIDNEGSIVEPETLAYTQGFYSGDGWEDKRGRQYIGLYGNKKHLISKLDTPISVSEYEVTGGYSGADLTQTRLFMYFGKAAMKPKNFVPTAAYSLSYRLSWLSGLIDADGCCTSEGCVQISSKEKEFLYDVKLLLNTLGINGYLSPMKDCWRISISAANAWKLFELGLRLYRVTGLKKPGFSKARKLFVLNVETNETCPIVYCFTEPKEHAGVFNGVYTSQCGEQPLPPFGACLLGSFNLTKYVTKSRMFDFDQLIKDIPHVVRAMDNVIDRTIYPLAQQGREARAKRRMGLGVTGLANAIEALGEAYGTVEFVKMQEKILDTIKNHTYLESVKLAMEKGVFAAYRQEYYLKGKFIKTLDPEVRAAIKESGIRNSHLTSIAPTGTISICADNVSSGIEPVFSHTLERTVNTPEGPKVETLKDYGLRVFGVKGKTTADVTITEHLRVLLAAQRQVDSAVSKTCNIGDNVTFEDFKNVYRKAYNGGAKGCTTFRAAGKRMGILVAKTEEESSGACSYDPATGTRSCES